MEALSFKSEYLFEIFMTSERIYSNYLVFFSDKNTIMYHDVQKDQQILYQLVAPKARKRSKKAKDKEKLNNLVIKKTDVTKTKRRRGRPRKDEKRNEEERAIDDKNTNEEEGEALPCSRTRYGRLSRPPKHMSKFIDVKEHLAPPIPDTLTTINDLISKKIATQLQTIDEMKVEILPKNLTESTEEVVTQNQPIQSEIKKKRNIDRFKCGICKKVRVSRHFTQCE